MVLYFCFRIYFIGGIYMSDIKFNELMKMISQMDKKELQSKLNEVSKMMNSKNPEDIIKQMNGKNSNRQ